jgi:hypothetical protein
MNQLALLKKIRARAKQDEKNRNDPRFLKTVGFLSAKGFLHANYSVPNLPNIRIDVEDALWAGRNVEPRILEVLPAAIARLRAHFHWDPIKHKALLQVVDDLAKRREVSEGFEGVSYKKLQIWANHPLRDTRVKGINNKKVLKTFRFNPSTLEALSTISNSNGCSETSTIETLIHKEWSKHKKIE